MPKRDDFEVEHDNEGEQLVSQLRTAASNNSTNNTDDPANDDPDLDGENVEAELSAAHIDMYRHTLRQRERRKKVAREHRLVSQFFKENPLITGAGGERKGFGGKTKKKDKTDLTERLKVLAEFQGVAEYQQFIGSMVKEKELKNKCKDLLRFRRNGITKLRESTEYEQQRMQRIRRKNELRKKLLLAGNNGSPATSMPMDLDSTSGDSQLSPVKQMSPGEFNIAGMPGFEILSSNEKKLCANLRLTPAQYVTYKTCLLTNHLQKKKGQTPKPINPDGLDKHNRKVIFQFLMRAGWITAY